MLQSSGGVRGLRGDVRLSGAFIDGSKRDARFHMASQQRRYGCRYRRDKLLLQFGQQLPRTRNTIMHEVGHALGFLHIQSSTDALLLEPMINLGIDGPQLDDIRGIHGFYGDALEKTNNGLGNGTYQRATPLGALTTGGTLQLVPMRLAARPSARSKPISSASPTIRTSTFFHSRSRRRYY